LHERSGDGYRAVDQVSLCSEPNVIGTRNSEGTAARAFEEKAAISLCEMKQQRAPGDLSGTENRAVVIGWRAGLVNMCRGNGLLCGKRRKREEKCTEDRHEASACCTV
jgi:hypothetical protein